MNDVWKKTTNPNAQAIFIHTIVNVIFKYMVQVKDTKHLFDNNVGVLGHIKTYYNVMKIYEK
jgi:hypothetical protein